MKIIIVLTALTLLFNLNAKGAFQAEIVIDGKFNDWESIKIYPDDENDTFGGPEDSTMDILSYSIANDKDFLFVMVTVKDDISKGKTSRGAYQTIVDSDNDYNTGIQSDTETPYPPHEKPLGVDRYISVETKNGQYLGVGMAGFMEDAKEIGGPGEFEIPQAVCDAKVIGGQYELSADLKSLGIDMESNIRIAILHYSGAGTADWTMPAITYFVTMQSPRSVDIYKKSAIAWGRIKNSK